MPLWLDVILLGIIEGITEFLPISSTGHMLLAQQWMTHRQSELFLVVIQSGAVAAVMLIFQDRLKQFLHNWREKEVRDYLAKLAVAFGITCVGGLALKAMHFKLPESALPVAVALLVGGLFFLGVEGWIRGRLLKDDITWLVAVAVGVAQLAAAVFPGISRSGATILVALILGLSRKSAIEFTFLLGVPTLLAASGLEIASHFMAADPEPVDWGMLALGTVVSAVTAFAAVKWLLHYVQTHTFVPFGWYRIVLALVILLVFAGQV